MDARARKPAPAPRPDRKRAILLAAEKLFAEGGYHGVSIRQIAEEAGVPLALVGYYYGQKHELYRAVFAHWDGTIAERLAALAGVMSQPYDAGKLQRIVEAFINPVLRLRASAEGEYYALLMTHSMQSHRAPHTDAVMREFFDPLARAFIDALRRTLAEEVPRVTQGRIAWCYQFALGALLNHLVDIRVERLSGEQNRANDPAAAALLVAFIVNGVRGAVRPLPTTPRRRA